MDHTSAKDLASRALEQPLDADQERDLALHLVSCADCKQFYDGLHGMRSALHRLKGATVPAEVVSASVHRAGAILQGQADPGPLGRAVPVPPDPGWEQEQAQAVPEPGPDEGLEDTADDAVADEPELETTAPMVIDVGADEGFTHEEPRTVVVQPAAPAPPVVPVRSAGHVRIRPDGPSAPSEPPLPPTPPEGAQVIWEEDEPRPRSTRTPLAFLLLLISALAFGGLAIAMLAGGDDQRPEGSPLPSTDAVVRGVATAFEELDAVQAEFTIQRLSVYPVPPPADEIEPTPTATPSRRTAAPDDEDDESSAGGRVTFSFSLATTKGRVAYEAPDRLREERVLDVPDAAPVRTTVVRTSDESRTLVIEPADRRAEVVVDPPLGPPSGRLAARLGVLEDAIAAPAAMLLGAERIEVVGQARVGSTDAVRVRFRVDPDPFTRADTIEMLLDRQTHFPLRVTRSISKADAQVLGPEQLLTPDAIDTAFGDRDRMTIERVDLTDLELNGVVLPGEFQIEVPEGVEPETTEADMQTATEEVVADQDWAVLEPDPVPDGFRKERTVVATGRPVPWGPRDRYPAPVGVVQSLYFNGRTTVVVDQRQLRRGPFDVEDSPLPGTTMPVTQRTLEAGPDRTFTYAVSPEVPPHVYGWVDDVFVVVTGYAPADDLLAFAAAMRAPEPSPSPEGSPGGSPRTSPTGSPAVATTRPRATP